jgi:lipid-A-disaccharide synthase
MRYYIIAGERSGDLHASNLVKALKEKDPQAIFRGFGGEYMEAVGVELAVHYNEMAIMGMVEIVKNIGRISHYIRKCKEDIMQFKPDVIILVDYGGFNGRIAKFGRLEGLKVFFYIPPKVWAWYQRRALQLKRNVNRIFVILPFEKDFFKKFDMEVDYVGNPVLDAIKEHKPDPSFLSRHNLTADKKIIALLPGSRKQELQNIIPVMGAVAKSNPSLQFVVAAIQNLSSDLYKSFHDLPNVKFVYEETYDLLTHAHAAIVTSGTATLETALFKVPQIVVYKTSYLTYKIVKLLIRIEFISLVNLIAGKEVVKEMIQGEADERKISLELDALINKAPYREQMVTHYNDIIKTLDTGSASKNAATLMVNYLKQ